MKIFLIGLPGSGKSTLGRQLAAAKGVAFVDLDTEIESRAGKSVQQFFRDSGEAAFRVLESTTLRDISLRANDFVMATGGGAPCFHEGIDFMNATGTTIFLDVPVAEIVKRLSRTNTADRPLVGVQSPAEITARIEGLYQSRQPIYARALHVVAGSTINVARLVMLLDGEKS